MVIRCAAAAMGLLLKCCAPPNNPVSHSKDLLHLVFRSQWSRECHGWYIRPVSSRALCTSPHTAMAHLTKLLRATEDVIASTKKQTRLLPECTRARLLPTIATSLNQTEDEEMQKLSWMPPVENICVLSWMCLTAPSSYEDSPRGWLVEKVRVPCKVTFWRMWMVITHKAAAIAAKQSRLLSFIPCESCGKRASSLAAVVMGRDSEQAVSQQESIEPQATTNTL